MIYCSNCAFARGTPPVACARREAETIDLVSGRPGGPLLPARSERKRGFVARLFRLDRCGPEAKYFERRSEAPRIAGQHFGSALNTPVSVNDPPTPPPRLPPTPPPKDRRGHY